MREFMRDQSPARLAVGRILTRTHYDVLPQSVGPSMYGVCPFGRLTVGVYADPTEVVSEARFHIGPHG